MGRFTKPRPLQNSPSPTAEAKRRISAVFVPNIPFFLMHHNRASGPLFRKQQAHLTCWRLSISSNISPSDGFACPLCSEQNRLPAHSGIYDVASQSSVQPHKGFSTNSGYASFALPSTGSCGGLYT